MARRKFSAKNSDPMDQWLESHGFYRKHTARDGSCLFRAVSEQVFLTQAAHKVVRKHCSDYMLRQRTKYSKLVDGSLEEYTKKLRNANEYGGTLELQAIAEFYRRDVHVFQQIGKPPIPLTNHGYHEQIILCSSAENHYDSVYLNSHINNAGFCQSIVYTILYANVFMLNDISSAVEIMLRKSVTSKKKTFLDFDDLVEAESLTTFTDASKIENIESDELLSNMKYLIACGLVPFPYKVAKALDPNIYRNIEFDAWSDMKRDKKYGILQGNELGEGVKCLVKFSPDQVLYAYIQHMEPDDGPVVVYVEELAKMCTVDYNQLEPLPKSERPPAPQTARRIRMRNVLQKLALNAAFDLGTKLKKTRLGKPRKVKEVLCPIQNPTISSTQITQALTEDKRCAADHATSPCYGNYTVANCSQSQNNNFTSNSVSTQSSVILPQDSSRTQEFNSSQHVVGAHVLMPVTPGAMYHTDCGIIRAQQNAVETGESPPPEPDSTTSIKSSDSVSHENVCANNATSQSVSPSCSCCPDNSYPKSNPVCVLSPSVQFVSHLPPRISEVTEETPHQMSSGPSTKILTGNAINGLNLVAQKSVLPDGSDLPLSDIQTLRFYYNLGCDWFRQSCLSVPVHVNNYTKGSTAAPPSPQSEVGNTILSHPLQQYAGHLQPSAQQKFVAEQSYGITVDHGCDSPHISNSTCTPTYTAPANLNQPYVTVCNSQYLPLYSVDGESPMVPISVPYFHYPVSPNMPVIVPQETEMKSDNQTIVQNSSSQVSGENGYFPGYTYYNLATGPYIIHQAPLCHPPGILPGNVPKWNTQVSFHPCAQYT